MLDCAIIGGGPAGLTAGMYAARGGLKEVVVFEKVYPGGQIVSSSEIENYPGFNEIKSGIDFMDSWVPQAQKFGCVVKSGAGVSKISKNSEFFTIELDDGQTYEARTVIMAAGTKPRKAGFEGEDEYFGRGVGVCAVCDGFFYRKKDVAVVGGGDSAVEESFFLSQFCNKVYLLARSELKAAPHTIERLRKTPNVEIIEGVNIIKAYGDATGLTGIEYFCNNQDIKLAVAGVFVFAGRTINNESIKTENGYICATDKSGHIVVDLKMCSSLDGFFAAGDIRIDSGHQVVCAAGDGAIAASSAIEYIHNKGL
ncbi:MAG: thioredoxin reductase [Pseudomonadota bacterium]|jgi:thioredoxin reductase (NADPH)